MRNKVIGHLKSMLVFGLLLFSPCMIRAEKFVFTTAWIPQAEFAGYYVAKEKGFYKEVGCGHSKSYFVEYSLSSYGNG